MLLFWVSWNFLQGFDGVVVGDRIEKEADVADVEYDLPNFSEINIHALVFSGSIEEEMKNEGARRRNLHDFPNSFSDFWSIVARTREKANENMIVATEQMGVEKQFVVFNPALPLHNIRAESSGMEGEKQLLHRL